MTKFSSHPESVDAITRHLDDCGATFRLIRHEPTTTSEASARARAVDLRTGAKALFVKYRDGFMGAVIPGDRIVNWKSLAALGFKKPRLGTDEELLEVTGLVKGTVPPFLNIFSLPVALDERLTRLPLVRFNACSLTDSVEMRGIDLRRCTAAVAVDDISVIRTAANAK